MASHHRGILIAAAHLPKHDFYVFLLDLAVDLRLYHAVYGGRIRWQSWREYDVCLSGVHRPIARLGLFLPARVERSYAS